MSEPADHYPFTVPGQQLGPNQPLWQWDDDNLTEHERFTSQVGGHLDAYTAFTTQVPDLMSLCRTGGVVVVGGPPHTGKSSLINRCLNRIRQEVPKAEQPHVHVFDFARHRSPGPSVQERTEYVAKLIRIKMGPINKPDWVRQQLDEDKTPSIESIFTVLNTMWENAHVKPSFLIVPPSLEYGSAAQEIDRYGSCVDRGIVCVLEVTTGKNPLPPAVAGAKPPVRLALRNLRPGEAYQLVEAWPDTSTHSPPILKEVMAKFEGTFMDGEVCELSVGVLLATLREVYRRRIDGTSQYQRVDSIEPEELFWAWRQVVINQSTGRGNPLS